MENDNRKKQAPTPRSKTAQQPSRPGTRPGSGTAQKPAAKKPKRRLKRIFKRRKRKTVTAQKQSAARTTQQNVRKPSAAETVRQRQISTSQRKRRRKYKHNYTIYYLMLAILLTVTGIALSLTVFFRIETIEISGSDYYNVEQIESLLRAEKGDNLLRYNASKDEQALVRALSRAETVSVKKKFPNTLLVEIAEGVPVKQIFAEGRYYYVGQSGRVLYSGTDPLPQVTTYLGVDGDFTEGSYLEKCMDSEMLRRFTELSSAIESKVPGVISLVNMTSTVDLSLCYENRIQVDLGSVSDLDEKLDMLRETMAGGEIDSTATGVMDLKQANMLVFNSLAELDTEMGLAGQWK